MAAIFRFGFEGENTPEGVSHTNTTYTVGRDTSGKALTLFTEDGNTDPGYIELTGLHDGRLYTSHFMKVSNLGTAGVFDILQFGILNVLYDLGNKDIIIRQRYSNEIVARMPVEGVLEENLWATVTFSASLDDLAGEMTVMFNGVPISYTGPNIYSNYDPSSQNLILFTGRQGYGQITLDDIAVNNAIEINDTVKIGSGASGVPPFIQAALIELSSEADLPSGWTLKGTSSIASALANPDDSKYIEAKYLGETSIEKASSSPDSKPNIEGLNIFTKQGILGTLPSIQLGLKGMGLDFTETTLARNGSQSLSLLRTPETDQKLTALDFDAMDVFMRTKKMNNNFFGTGNDGNVVISEDKELESIYRGPPVVLECKNLWVQLGATLTASNRCRGLFIYAQGDVIIDGTISMDSKGCKGGEFEDENPTLYLQRNDDGVELNLNTASPDSGNPISLENIYQAVGTTSTRYETPIVGGAGGITAVTANGARGNGAPGIDGGCGGGGAGGPGYYAAGGDGTAGHRYGGGSSGAGGGDRVSPVAAEDHGGKGGSHNVGGTSGRRPGLGVGDPIGTSPGYYYAAPSDYGAGGVIYIVAKGNIYISETGSITSNGAKGAGSAGVGAGGGSGGGSITLLHGGTYANSGEITVDGGDYSTSTYSGGYSGAGGAGSIRTKKILRP